MRGISGTLPAMKIVFLGSGAFGVPSLKALKASRHEILHVISQPDRPAGRGNKLTPTPVSAWAAANGLPLTRTENANGEEVMGLLRGLAPECLVVIAFGQKLSDELLKVAPHGGINLHSSLLPKYRGAAPINWAVIHNDAEAGVSVIEVTSVMDAGDILATAATPVGDAETAGELHDRLALLGAPLLPRVLDGLEAGTVVRVKQDKTLASRAPKLSREMAWVDFTQPAATVSARVRGLSPWPGVQVEVIDAAGKSRGIATVVKCRAASSHSSHAEENCGKVLPDKTVACGAGSLELITVQPAGKKAMDLTAFANGYGYGPGAKLKAVVAVPPM
jgi:methionyl-tRNA formyltransferase